MEEDDESVDDGDISRQEDEVERIKYPIAIKKKEKEIERLKQVQEKIANQLKSTMSTATGGTSGGVHSTTEGSGGIFRGGSP